MLASPNTRMLRILKPWPGAPGTAGHVFQAASQTHAQRLLRLGVVEPEDAQDLPKAKRHRKKQ